MRDLDLGAPVTDTRRLEVVVDGLPLFGGVQLAVDTTLVTTLNCDGSAHRGTADRDGVVLETARRRKERRYPNWSVRAAVPDWWCLQVKLLAVGRKKPSHSSVTWPRLEPPLMRRRIEQAWRLQWTSLLTCTAARAFATSLLEMRTAHGADGAPPPAHEVVADFRYAGLGGPDGAT